MNTWEIWMWIYKRCASRLFFWRRGVESPCLDRKALLGCLRPAYDENNRRTVVIIWTRDVRQAFIGLLLFIKKHPNVAWSKVEGNILNGDYTEPGLRRVMLTSEILGSSKILNPTDVWTLLLAILPPCNAAKFRTEDGWRRFVITARLRLLYTFKVGRAYPVACSECLSTRIAQLSRWSPVDERGFIEPKLVLMKCWTESLGTSFRLIRPYHVWYVLAAVTNIVHSRYAWRLYWLPQAYMCLSMLLSSLGCNTNLWYRLHPRTFYRVVELFYRRSNHPFSRQILKASIAVTKHIVYSTRAKMYGSVSSCIRGAYFLDILRFSQAMYHFLDRIFLSSWFEKSVWIFDLVVNSVFTKRRTDFTVKRIFLKKSGQPLCFPSAIPYAEADQAIEELSQRGIMITRTSPLKIVGYRLINYVPPEVYFPLKCYYEIVHRMWLKDLGLYMDNILASQQIIHLTSAGVWNYRRLLEHHLSKVDAGSTRLDNGWVSWGYDINAFFDNTNSLPPWMNLLFGRYLMLTKLGDMPGVAVQGLYLSSWINSYSFAIAIQRALVRYNLVNKVLVFVYVDNLQVFAPSELVAATRYALDAAVKSIGCSMKDDEGFCSWKNPLEPLSAIRTRDMTENQIANWTNTASNELTPYARVLMFPSATCQPVLWFSDLEQLIDDSFTVLID